MQDKITKCLGLVQQYNPLTTQPGALSKANDILIRRENVIEDRRGHKAYGSLATQTAQLMSYLNSIISHRGTNVAFDNGSGVFTDYSGSYSAITGQKMRFTEQFSNLYATTSLGVKVFTDIAGTAARSAGVPRSLDPSAALNAGTTGFLTAGNQCAYRTCIQRTDANTNSLRGYPSTRLWVTNPVFNYTGNATNGSNSVTAASSTVGLITGMLVTGSGIPAGTTLSAIVGSVLTLSNNALLSVTPTGNTTTGSNVIANVSSLTGISVGMAVSGTGIPTGSVVIGISTTSLTINYNATATGTAVTLTISISGTGLALSFSANRNVDLTLFLPTEATVNDVIEFYRTAQIIGTSSDASGDEMGLVYQVALASADISNGFVTFTDSITDSLRGATLYTSPSQEGISQANDRPPLSKDIGFFKSKFMLYANTSTKQRLFVTMVGTSGLSGNTITLGGVTYNFGSTEIVSGGGSPQAQIGTTGVAAVDIDTTARSLVRVINRFASNASVYAYYLTGPGDLPGQILVEEKGIGASAFTLQASAVGIAPMFFPAPPVSPSTNAKSTSSNQIQKNAVYYSKIQQGEHVPALNYLLVGPANKNILRIAPLRDSTIVIKEEGIYRISGEDPTSFTVVPIDLTVFCKSADSVAVLGNQVYMLSNQGVVAISDTAVQVISRDIEQLIQPLLTYSSISSLTTGFAYESERSYYISTMSNPADLAQTQTFVYNYFTKTWVRHSYAFVAGVVGADDKMYFAKPSDINVYQERKSFSDNDYADPEFNITITALGGTIVTFTLGAQTPKAGWAINQNGVSISILSFTTGLGGSYTATLSATIPSAWTTGAAIIYPSVGMDIQWQSWTNNNADALRQVRAIGILADDESTYNSVTQLQTNFSSNFDAQTESVPMITPGIGWGSAWGASPWGGQADSAGYPTYVPKNKQYCTRLAVGVSHPAALERLSIAGVCFSFETVSDRIGR